MAKDYYKTLGVDKNSSKDDIKKAYKKLAKQFHPDLNKDPGASDKFKEINEAASILGDDQKRQHYDQFGTAEGQGFDYRDFSSRASGEDFDFDNIFDMFFGGGGQGSFSRRRRNYAGSDLRFDIEIELEDVAHGAEKTISLKRLEKCSTCDGKGAKDPSDIMVCGQCHGSGQETRTRRTPFGIFQTTTTCSRCSGVGEVIKNPCKTCGGKGRAEKESRIKINIPAGVEGGMRLRYAGEGEAGTKGAASGDLYIMIHVNEHDVFERVGDDLSLELPVSFTQAALGDTIDVPTIDDKTKLKVPAGTQANTVFRLKGYGIPHLNGYGKGDELVKVVVQTPLNMTKKQKELLEQFAKESGESAEPSKGFFKKIFEKI